MKMAKQETVRLRPNTTEENRAVLRELQARREVDARRQDELNALFDRINAECAATSLRLKRKALASAVKLEKAAEAVHYGPLPEFLSGKWWGIRMDCSRDCVHEPLDETVHEGPYGAVSICTPLLNKHCDVDLGDLLTFTSQEYSPNDLTKDSLILSYKNKVPVRLIRSYCLSNNYAPKTGHRYDGLYTVVDYWVGVSSDTTKHRKFALIRVLDQEPPVWEEKMSKASRARQLTAPRITRSYNNVSSKDKKPKKFVCNRVQKKPKEGSVSAIVSRQVFKKTIPDSPVSLSKAVSSIELSQSSCSNSCSSNSCDTNLSIRTNLYNSLQKLQDDKKASAVQFSRVFKSSVHYQQKNSHEAIEKTSEILDSELMDIVPSTSSSSNDHFAEKKMKKVTWADSSTTIVNSIEKPVASTSNGFQYSGSGVIDGFSPTPPDKCYVDNCNNKSEQSSLVKDSMSNSILSPSTKNSQHIVQVHSKPSISQTSRASFSTMCESIHETEKSDEIPSNIETLAPDELVNVIVKEKYHPMAQLIIGNMIGLESQESSILSNAYNTLTSKIDPEITKMSKENKLRNKFYIRNKSRKNVVLKKQRREIANLIIDAKFDAVTRGSRNSRLRTSRKRISKSDVAQRKLVNGRRIQSSSSSSSSRNINKEILSSVREVPPKKPEHRKVEETPSPRRLKMISTSVQCTLLIEPTVNQSLQTDESCFDSTLSESDIKVELVDLEEIKSEPCDSESVSAAPQEFDAGRIGNSCSSNSAFAAVNTIDSSTRIARLRAIGFRPIGTCSLVDEDHESPRPEVDEEYNKYTSEENDVVGYMDEQLHFEDIEDEDAATLKEINFQKSLSKKRLMSKTLPRPIETLTEEDFNEPWHGWEQISANGQTYWTGY